eukprot:Lithocolla_globosa_v1_NODE_2314_length_2052_cov_37.928929.p1 type:complete len:356 gc:universal NODE_2314_length_2052_cov_37.928929:82-1149(+)
MKPVTIGELRTLYNDPVTGNVGKTAFIRNLKSRGVSFNKKDVDDLYKETAIQLNTPARKNFDRRPVVVLRVDQTWGLDLSFLPQFKKYNDGYSILLFCIDFLSKYLWVRPLKDAKAITVSKALEDIFKTSGRVPESVNVDGGSEFKKETLAMLRDKKIRVYQSYNTVKVPIVERSIRTMKGRISRYQDSTGSYRYIDTLQKLVRGYNSTRHSTIKMSPMSASKPENYLRLVTNFFGSIKSKVKQEVLFSVGDTVRLSIQKDRFGKESDGSWTKEIFKVKKVLKTHPPTYKIEDINGEEIMGSFYNQELLKVADNPRDLDTVVVLKTRTVKKQPQSYVEYSDGTKAWIKTADLTSN